MTSVSNHQEEDYSMESNQLGRTAGSDRDTRRLEGSLNRLRALIERQDMALARLTAIRDRLLGNPNEQDQLNKEAALTEVVQSETHDLSILVDGLEQRTNGALVLIGELERV